MISNWEKNTKERINNYDLKECVRRFWELVDKKETSDEGIVFKPNQLVINSCRCLDASEISWLIDKMKTEIK